jgi:LysM repeat protein
LKVRFATFLREWGRWLLVVVLALLVTVGSVVSVQADTDYKVQEGDNLITLAQRFGVTVDAIVAANNLPSRTIYAGQMLRIPSVSSGPAAPGTYVVQPGDTLSEIAVRYGTTTEALMQINGLPSTTIRAGQVLRITGSAAAATPKPATPRPQAVPGTYVVQEGDNLITLAQRFGVSREALAAANGISPSSLLYIGQTLRIPGAPASQQGTPTPKPPLPTAQPTTTPKPVTVPANAEPGKPVQYTVQPGDNLSTIALKFNTTVEAIMDLNKLTERNLLRVGQVLTIVRGNDQDNNPPSKDPVLEPVPPMGALGPKWIDVNISTQTMVAFEGQTPVYTSKMSTGTPRHPTVEGTYRVYAKYKNQSMRGGEGAERYYLPNVPYVMYFYSGYALHGANWHNNFGQPMSHGCVNLPVDAANWMFEWAPIGTMVVSHK